MIKYKFITICKEGELLNKKFQYVIRNNKTNDMLGVIFYYPQWRQYVFTQAKENLIFNKDCLLNIIDFIDKLN